MRISDKIATLIETLPYISQFAGAVFVIKCGGSALIESSQIHTLIEDLKLLKICGIKPILVHGGGPEINALCQRLGMPVEFAQGQRVTDQDTMKIVQMVLKGNLNATIVSLLNKAGVKAVGFSGLDSSFIKVKKYESEDKVDFGYVGDIIAIDTTLLDHLLESNYLPVISPIGVDEHGCAYNINADQVAGKLAAAFSAEKLIILTDVNGLYADKHDPKTLIQSISACHLEEKMQAKLISGGMIPKIRSVINALYEGVCSAHILNGTEPHSILLEIFTDEGVGTCVKL